jgi:hypothetical protein
LVEAERLTALNSLVAWMRGNGVRRAKVADLELEFAQTPSAPAAAPGDARPKSQEDLAGELREARRRRLSVELGVAVTDEMLERLT